MLFRLGALAVLVCAVLSWSPAQAARLFTGGFEENDVTTTMWNAGTGTVVTTNPASGTYHGQINVATSQFFRRDLAASATSGTYYARTKFRVSNAARTDHLLNWKSDGGVTSLRVEKVSTGVIRLTNVITGTNVSTAATISANTWHMIDTEILLSDTVGTMRLRFYSGSPLTLTESLEITGEDTLPTNLRQLFLQSSSAAADTIQYDDVAINDTTGSVQNSWPGPGNIYLLAPNAEVSTTWTPNTGTDNSANVDDVPGAPDDDTTYNSSSTANDEDRLGLTNLGAEVPSDATIAVVDVYARVRGEGTSATRQMRMLLWDEGGAQTNGPTTALNDSTAYAIMSTADHLVLNGSGKTKANLDSFDVGYEPLTAHPTRVSAVWVNVEWMEAAAISAANNLMLLWGGQ